MKRWKLIAAGLLWLTALGGGLSALWGFENTPGAVAQKAPTVWPSQSGVPRVAGLATLVIAAHPQCPCSRATVGELALVMARAQPLTTAHVLFYRPVGAPVDWHETNLWDAAAKIPGVTVGGDPGGVEARRFGVATSGHTLLYDKHGVLKFSGGITASRGHSGDNAGRTAILSLLLARPTDRHTTFVFGCSLLDLCPNCREGVGGAILSAH